jgi:hypothetical protein
MGVFASLVANAQSCEAVYAKIARPSGPPLNGEIKSVTPGALTTIAAQTKPQNRVQQPRQRLACNYINRKFEKS